MAKPEGEVRLPNITPREGGAMNEGHRHHHGTGIDADANANGENGAESANSGGEDHNGGRHKSGRKMKVFEKILNNFAKGEKETAGGDATERKKTERSNKKDSVDVALHQSPYLNVPSAYLMQVCTYVCILMQFCMYVSSM
jgi:hypothetical protein